MSFVKKAVKIPHSRNNKLKLLKLYSKAIITFIYLKKLKIIYKIIVIKVLYISNNYNYIVKITLIT